MKLEYKIKKSALLLGLMISLAQCKKFIEVNEPVTSSNAGIVYSSDATAAAVLTGIYSHISLNDRFPTLVNLTGISIFTGLSSDELILDNDPNYLPFYRNELTPLTSAGNFWKDIYTVIFYSNSAIEGLNNSNGLTPSVKQQLIGEAKFLRAYWYFYLINLYGDVPLALSTDWKVNSSLPRSSKSDVYLQIISDLKEAQNLLSENYLKSDVLTAYTIASAERVRPTKGAATALLARAYLYNNDWSNAEAQASMVINNSSFYSLTSPNNVFLKNSKETIWSLQPVGTGTNSNTAAGALFILPSAGPDNNYPVYLSKNVVNSFEAGDLRKTSWVDSVKPNSIAYYYPKKYKIGKVNTATQEYIIMLRLGEQYLIRAEARAKLNDITGAQADLNMIRARANLGQTSANTMNTLLAAIQRERAVELFTEWGDRWFDIRRTGVIDVVMNIVAVQKNTTWNSLKALYPIPQIEINRNHNLIQNAGY